MVWEFGNLFLVGVCRCGSTWFTQQCVNYKVLSMYINLLFHSFYVCSVFNQYLYAYNETVCLRCVATCRRIASWALPRWGCLHLLKKSLTCRDGWLGLVLCFRVLLFWVFFGLVHVCEAMEVIGCIAWEKRDVCVLLEGITAPLVKKGKGLLESKKTYEKVIYKGSFLLE